MSRIDKDDLLNTVILGMFIGVFAFFMIGTFLAQLILDLIIGYIDDDIVLVLIVLSFELVSLVISLFVGFLINDNVQKSCILKASIMAFVSNLAFLVVLSYVCLMIFYPQVFENVGIWIFVLFPEAIMYFGLYVVGNVFILFILSQVSYFVIFGVFLYKFSEPKERFSNTKIENSEMRF